MHNMTKGESVPKTHVWHNKNICVAKKSIFYNDWKVKGVSIINDFIKCADSREFYTFHEFSEKTQINTNFLKYHGIVAAIKKFLCSFNLQNLRLDFPMIPVNIEIVLKSKKGIKDFYNILNKNNTIPTGRKKWDQIFDFNDHSWTQIYKIPFMQQKILNYNGCSLG